MAVIEQTIKINRPFSDVFKQIADFDNLQGQKAWQPTLTAANVTAGSPIRAGSSVSMRKQLMGGSIFINADVVDFQRNKRIELKGVYGRFRFTRAIELATGGRETTIRDTFDLRTPWFYFWYSPFFVSALRRQNNAEWERLKALLEK